MLSKFLKRRGNALPKASVPATQRLYAIGDIHGRDDLLAQLLAMIDADDAARGPAETTIIVLGDLVDRGPDSSQVVERLRRLQQERPRVRLLTGNHEEILLEALDNGEKALRLFARIGGRETLLSYGVTPEAYDRADYVGLHQLLVAHVPEAHRAFLASFEDLITVGGYTFVHAGVRPTAPLEEQRLRDLRWIREPFLSFPRPIGTLIVHGHTISEEVEEREHRIGIDTGAYFTGRLTAIGLEGTDRWYLAT